MHDTDPKADIMQRARVVLDWTIFTLGVLSLSAAITATLLTKANVFGGSEPAAVEQKTTG